jgi:hypothetical protein
MQPVRNFGCDCIKNIHSLADCPQVIVIETRISEHLVRGCGDKMCFYILNVRELLRRVQGTLTVCGHIKGEKASRQALESGWVLAN